MNHTISVCETSDLWRLLGKTARAMGLLLSLQILLMASQSAILTNNRIGNFNVPGSSPYNNLGSNRVELRVHNWVVGTTNLRLFTNAGYVIELSVSGEICASNIIDSLNDYGGTMCGDVAGQSDVVLRVQRDIATKRFSLDIFSTSGSWQAVTYCGNKIIGTNINRFPCPIRTVNLNSWAGPGSIGGGSGSASIAWVKWFSSVNITPETSLASYNPADLGDWRFEGNGTNVNGNMNISMGSIGYQPSPGYPPNVKIRSLNAPDWTDWVSARAGHPAAFDGRKSVSFTDAPPVSYLWEQKSGPSSLILDNATDPVLQVRGAVFGTYTLSLRVSDDEGREGYSELTFGAVATDDNGVVVSSNPATEEIFGPLIAFGKNPWPWADSRHKYLAEFFGDKLDTDPDFYDTWNRPGPGTINVTNGSTTVVGTGTTFQTTFSCNGTDKIVIPYPRPSGGTGRAAFIVASCASNTSLTLASAYSASATVSGIEYGTYPAINEFFYSNGINNINYYDNVLAHYALYFRSGNTKYRDYARKLAGRWWTSPTMDRGLTGLIPRSLSPTGLMACMVLDNCPEHTPVFQYFWADYEAGLENWEIFIKEDRWPGDLREESYRAHAHALGAKFDPNPLKAARYRADITTGLTAKFFRRQRPTGTIWSKPGDLSSPKALVTNGSKTVTAINGYSFPSQLCTPSTYTPLVHFIDSWETADTEAYTCTWVSANTITLNRPYSGTTGNKDFGVNNLVGQGTQPFILGIPATYFRFHNVATNSTAATPLLTGITDWLTVYGLNPGNKGLYYGREFPGCEPPTLINCTNGGTDVADYGARFLAAETFAAWSWSYLAAPTTARRDRGDLHYGANFGKLGGPQTAEGYYAADFEDNGWVVTTRKAKDYGFAFGFGFASTWPAARLGGAKPAMPLTSKVAVDFGDAAAIRVTITQPSGQASVVTCQPNDPCQVTLDARQGSHWRKIEFLDAGGSPIEGRTANELLDLP